MAGSLLAFETSQYEKHDISSFIYEPVKSNDGSPPDFKIVYASDVFARDWQRIHHNDDCLGARLRKDTLLDEHTLELITKFRSEEPYPFVSYIPLLDMHLFFEPILNLPHPYAGFYITNITNYASQEGRDHFLQNIRQMNNNAVLYQQHADGRIEPIFISTEFAQMMECSIAEAKALISGMGFYKTTKPEDRPPVRSMLRRHVAHDGGKSLTIRKITAKNNVIWCNVHCAFIKDFGNDYIYCTYTDVTALKGYEERLRSIYTNIGNIFYQADDKTLSMFRVNLTKDSLEEVKGRDLYDSDSIAYSFSDLMRQRATHFLIISERTRFLQLFNKDKLCGSYLSGRVTVSQMLYSVRKDGRACFVNFSASLARHPLNNDIIAFITEKECNGAKVDETLTSKILAEQFDMVAYIANDRYGVTIGEATKVKHGSIFPTANSGDYQQYLEERVYPVLSGDDDRKKEMQTALSLETVKQQLKLKEAYVVNISIEIDGEIYYKQFDFYRIDPKADFYILLKSDTTEIQKQHVAMNEQLHMALEAANQANVAKTAFLSSTSHEIRTPMNAIIGLSSIAMKDPEISDRTRGYLEKIDAGAKHLLSLINDILDMSRIESGRLTIKKEEFSFADMLEQINTMVSSQCRDRGLDYECRVLSRVDDYYIGDSMKLKQVIINILGNAVKFTPPPGTISFTVERMNEFEGQSAFQFTMKDTGIGMDKEYLPRIFEAFSQEREGHSNKYGSTGLGMAITKNIVELMNGDISVQSEKGVGTTFTVNVTLRNSSRKSKAFEGIEPQQLKVLVIDDDPVACEHARIVLEEIGISADTAESGRQAIEAIQLKAARREAYNLIFVDWHMPEQNGFEVTQEIRKMVGFDSAVIILTAYNWDEIEEQAKAAGVDNFMSKPLFASNVLSAFQQAMSNKQIEEKKNEPADLTDRKILLVEDMFVNAEIMKELLNMMGMTTDHAENGQIAVDMFSASDIGSYDAILMDVRMPVMDGLKATAAIRALDRPDAKTIPIIAMTANAFDEDVQRSLQVGMNAHLSKPVEPDRLYATLGELIRG